MRSISCIKTYYFFCYVASFLTILLLALICSVVNVIMIDWTHLQQSLPCHQVILLKFPYVLKGFDLKHQLTQTPLNGGWPYLRVELLAGSSCHIGCQNPVSEHSFESKLLCFCFSYQLMCIEMQHKTATSTWASVTFTEWLSLDPIMAILTI